MQKRKIIEKRIANITFDTGSNFCSGSLHQINSINNNNSSNNVESKLMLALLLVLFNRLVI
jgi:hypothetical protein